MRNSLRNRLSGGRQVAHRPARLSLYTALAAAGLAALAITVVSLDRGSPASSARAASRGYARLFAVHPLPCGSGSPGAIGTVVRTTGTTTGSSPAAQGITFPVTILAHAEGTTLYVAPRGAALSPSHSPSTQLGIVTVPSVHPAYRSCNYALQDNERDQSFKAAAEQAFVAARLATHAQLNGQGVIWMVADDPTSASDELVAVDIETPMTSSSPGTIRTLVAAVDPSDATVLGEAATDW
jgi:hypothetical protein